ncbi:hypothetical protein HRG_012223 [Hirsutella rhossiliensis]
MNSRKVQEGKEAPNYFSCKSERGGLHYNVTSLGHPIGLKTEYPSSSLKKHDIKLRKGQSAAMKSMQTPIQQTVRQVDQAL